MSKLQPTYGNFKLRGVVTGIGNTYEDKTSERTGNKYRKLRFYVKTSKFNQVPVEIMGSKLENVTIYNGDKKSKNYKDKKVVKWNNRYDKHPEGYDIIGVSIGLEKDDNGKNITKNLLPYDAAEYLNSVLKDGDSVMILGRMVFSEYEKDGQTVSQLKYEINKVYRANDPIDIEDEGTYIELSDFKQEIIIAESMVDKDNNKLVVNTYIVTNKDGEYISYPFVVDLSNEQLKPLGRNLSKQKFGTSIVVEGQIVNKVETETVTIEEPDEWGLPSTFDKQTVRNVIKELSITKGLKDTLQEKRYTESDFIGDSNDDDWNTDDDDDGLPF